MSTIDLLSPPLMIPLVCCHIKSFRRASRCGEAIARRRKEERRAGIAARGMGSDEAVAPPVGGHRGVPARGVVPERRNSWGQPWTPAVTRPQGCKGLSARRMAVL
jgi:hypothetical protein